MKKIMVLLLFVVAIQITARADERAITVDQLPQTAQQLINTHFGDMDISLAKMDEDMFETSYKVLFTNGNKIEFTSNGEWKEINCKSSQVPQALLPDQILNYVNDTQNSAKIVEIERDEKGYEIKLDNGAELKFDTQYNLMDYDR